MSLPTVFMQEGTSDEIVGIGWLSRVELQGRDYQLRFTLDPMIPRLTNSDLHAMASELQMEDWEFSRNHWAIKNVDLFQVLYRKKVGERPVPRRADDFWLHPHIMHDILELITTSQVIICDLSGKNPNVFYEAGIAHTLGKEVILITQHESDVPFDLRPLRYISYLNNSEGRQELAGKIVARLQTVA